METKNLPTGLQLKPATAFPTLPAPVELFGHITLIEAYDTATYAGSHALVALRDTPGATVAILTTSVRELQLLNTAVNTGNLIAFRGTLLPNPPAPLGGTWSVPVYGNIVSVILYNFQ